MKNTKTIQPYVIEPTCSINLSISENPLGTSTVVFDVLKKVKLKPSKYPTINGNSLRYALANFLNCELENVFVANGSEAIIRDIPRILAKPNDEVLIPQLTFPLFAQYSQLAQLKVRLISMTADLGIDLKKMLNELTLETKLLILCNPNNPTGMTLSRQEISTFLDQIPQTISVVIDEANIDFGGETVIDQAINRPNVLVLRTFSKGFGLAGMRVGFAVGSEKLIQKFITQTPPFPITTLSENLAIVALTDLEFINKSKQLMTIEREKIKQTLTKLSCTVFSSQANNIFVKLPPTIKPSQFFRELTENDISVVKGSKFIDFDDSYFRVSPRDTKTNDLFLIRMKKILKANT